MNINVSILLNLLGWTLLPFGLIYLYRLVKWPTVGFVTIYITGLYMAHAPGAFIYTLPWYYVAYEGYLTLTGHALTILGLVSFTVGCLITNIVWPRRMLPTKRSIDVLSTSHPHLPLLLFVIGWLFALFLSDVLAFVPSSTSITSAFSNLYLVGIGLGIHQNLTKRNYGKVLLWFLVLPLIPLITLATDGFIGFGIGGLLIVICFVYVYIRPQWWHLLFIPLAIYFSLSLFVTYLAGRDEIRNVVWGGEDYSARVDILIDNLGDWQWFDWRNHNHLFALDVRLNQDYLVGTSIVNLENKIVNYAEGETMVQAIVAFIPRAIWPEKPSVVGGSELVTRFTGIGFLGATSISMGQVMEFNANFGVLGVIIGFVVLGSIITTIDRIAAIHFSNKNFYQFILWYLPGLPLLEPTGHLSQMTAGFAGALVAAFLLTTYLKQIFEKKPIISSPRYTRPAIKFEL